MSCIICDQPGDTVLHRPTPCQRDYDPRLSGLNEWILCEHHRCAFKAGKADHCKDVVAGTAKGKKCTHHMDYTARETKRKRAKRESMREGGKPASEAGDQDSERERERERDRDRDSQPERDRDSQSSSVAGHVAGHVSGHVSDGMPESNPISQQQDLDAMEMPAAQAAFEPDDHVNVPHKPDESSDYWHGNALPKSTIRGRVVPLGQGWIRMPDPSKMRPEDRMPMFETGQKLAELIETSEPALVPEVNTLQARDTDWKGIVAHLALARSISTSTSTSPSFILVVDDPAHQLDHSMASFVETWRKRTSGDVDNELLRMCTALQTQTSVRRENTGTLPDRLCMDHLGARLDSMPTVNTASWDKGEFRGHQEIATAGCLWKKKAGSIISGGLLGVNHGRLLVFVDGKHVMISSGEKLAGYGHDWEMTIYAVEPTIYNWTQFIDYSLLRDVQDSESLKQIDRETQLYACYMVLASKTLVRPLDKAIELDLHEDRELNEIRGVAKLKSAQQSLNDPPVATVAEEDEDVDNEVGDEVDKEDDQDMEA